MLLDLSARMYLAQAFCSTLPCIAHQCTEKCNKKATPKHMYTLDLTCSEPLDLSQGEQRGTPHSTMYYKQKPQKQPISSTQEASTRKRHSLLSPQRLGSSSHQQLLPIRRSKQPWLFLDRLASPKTCGCRK